MDIQQQLDVLSERVRRHTHDGNETPKLPLTSLTTTTASGGVTSVTGTTDQVIVTGTTSVVLSLPQSIQTTSAPGFAKIGLGQSADTTAVMAATGQYFSAEYDNGNITSTATINWNNGLNQYATMTGNVTLTFTNPKSGAHYTLHLAGAFTPTFPGSVRWTGGTTAPPTISVGHKDIYTLIYSGKESLYDILQSANYATT